MNRQSGTRCFLHIDKLVVEKDVFIFNELTGKVRKCSCLAGNVPKVQVELAYECTETRRSAASSPTTLRARSHSRGRKKLQAERDISKRYCFDLKNLIFMEKYELKGGMI